MCAGLLRVRASFILEFAGSGSGAWRHAPLNGEPAVRDAMDLLALFAAVLSTMGSLPGRRITVKDRYEMKRKVRELKKREREQLSKST